MKIRILNSTLYLIAAYFVVHLVGIVSQYIILLFLSVEKLNMTFFYNTYVSPPNYWWSRTKVMLIFGIGVVAVAFFLFLVTILFIKLSRKKYRLNVFFNWLIIVASSSLIASFLAAPFFKELSPVYTVLRWLYFKNGGGGMYLFGLILLLFVPLIGYFTNKPFLKMSSTTRWLKTKTTRTRFFLATAVLPFFILTIIISGLVYLSYSYPLYNALSSEGLKLAIIASVLIFGGIFNFNKKYVSIQKSNTMHKIDAPMSVFIIIASLASYLLLWLNLS